jgi:tRNA threonylcarbamoyl adenosine modification protein (Sua5/YciO/YrdC/YwlC family)
VLIQIHPEYPESRKIQRAVEAIDAGEIIAYPTDTVYGLGCDPMSKRAVERLYQMKQMSRAQPLALICPDLSDISKYAHVDNQSYRLLKRLLPGPYTFVLPASREVPKMLQSARRTVGIRVPKSAAALQIVRALGRPLISTSAGPHGQDAFTDPRDIERRFPGLAFVLDGGLGGSVPTTVVDLVEQRVIREGAGPVESLF